MRQGTGGGQRTIRLRQICRPDHKQPEEAEVFTITDFDGLDEAVQPDRFPGTKLDELNLPATLRASGYTVTDNTEPTSGRLPFRG